MRLALLLPFLGLALAGCAGTLPLPDWDGVSTERPAWRRETPPAPGPRIRTTAPYGMDRA